MAFLEPAPLWRRILSSLYDLLPVAALLMIGNGAVVLVARLATGADDIRPVLAIGWPHVAQQVVLLALVLAYYLLSWRRGGQTIGMRAWKIRLISESPLGFWRSLQRAALSVILIGWLWCPFDPERRALQDHLCRTRMVRC